MGKSSNITSNNFINTSENNFKEKESTNNVKKCKPTYNFESNNNSTIPVSDTPINVRNTDKINTDATDFFNFVENKSESGKNWYKETKTSNGPGYFATTVTYTYNSDASENLEDVNDGFGFNIPNMFFFNDPNIFFDFMPNLGMPNYLNQLQMNNNSQQLQAAFSALSINKEKFDQSTSKEQEREIKLEYHKAARKCHPDRNNDKDATAKFQELEGHKKVLLEYAQYSK